MPSDETTPQSFEESQIFGEHSWPKSLLQKAVKLRRLITRIQSWPGALADHLRLSRGTYVCHLRDVSAMEIRGHTGRYSLFPGRGSQTISVACLSLDDIVRENNLRGSGFKVSSRSRLLYAYRDAGEAA